jgi:pyrimidine-nucleoside phosphorylase
MTGRPFVELIEAKRDGRTHTADEIERIVSAFAKRDVPDYQLSAWLMAAYVNGLSHDETVLLTGAMARSGEVVDLSPIGAACVDKHSTGGVADTTTLVVAPLVAACGVPVAKMSGRGLGHTGGTLDKLEAIPGMRTDLTAEEFVAQVRRIGIAVISQSAEIDPADKVMYALRDVTGTVPSLPLIVASVLSKKIAGGAQAILIDVKAGSGAFMKTSQRAIALAEEMERVGHELGRDVACVVTRMEQPLGRAVGNALEVREAVDVLAGRCPGDLEGLSVLLAARLLVLGGRATDEGTATALARDALASGAGLAKLREWVAAQGGDPRVAHDPDAVLPHAAATREVFAEEAGYIASLDAEQIGRAAGALGAGRLQEGDAIDPAAGIVLGKRVGDPVAPGEVLATLYAASDDLLDAGEERFRGAAIVSAGRVEPAPLVLER